MRLDDSIGTDAASRAGELHGWYEAMLRIRGFEIRATELFKQGLIRGSLHSYVGMEAGAVGVCSALRADDVILTYHRGHGHCLAKGLDPCRVLAELLGREDGYCRGKGGTMHVASVADGVLGADGVVGGMLPVAVGVGYALKLRGTGAIPVVFFGEGAVNQGTFHESLNLAAIHRVPVVFVCENNMWAMNTRSSLVTAPESLVDLASQYGIAGEVVVATDVRDVFVAATTAVARSREDVTPSFLELKTYRWGGHSAYVEADPRPPDELAAWQATDPIATAERALCTEHGADEEDLARLRAVIEEDLNQAVTAACALAPPPDSSAYENVYAEGDVL